MHTSPDQARQPAPTTLADELPALSPECEALLTERDLYSEPCPIAVGLAVVRSIDDGAPWFRVERTISPFTLRVMLQFGTERYMRGYDHGRDAVRGQLRALIGAQEAAQ